MQNSRVIIIMTGPRLTRAEKQHLVERAVLEKFRRRQANAKARADRIAQGRRRLEKTVPAQFRAEIRRIVAAALAEIEAGREPRFRTLPAAPSDASTAPGPSVGSQSTAAPPPPPGTRGLGTAGRKRAQAARRRRRQRAAGLTRTTFEVPASLMTRISALVDRLVAWMRDGQRVILEDAPIQHEPAQPVPAPPLNSNPSVVAETLDGLVNPDVDCGDGQLFDDIQAAVRLASVGDRGSGGDKF